LAGFFPFNWSNLCTRIQSYESARVTPCAGIMIGRLNGILGSFKLGGENQPWNEQLTYWRNFLHWDITGQSCCPLRSNRFNSRELPPRAQIGPVMSK